MEHPELVERIRALLPSRTIGRLDYTGLCGRAAVRPIVRTLAAPHRNGVDLAAPARS